MEDMTKKFAKALHDRRKQLGLSQEELAQKIGTKKQVISKYELGQRSPKIYMANAIAEALGTTLNELLGIDKEDNIVFTDIYNLKETPVYKGAIIQKEDPEIHIVSAMMETMTKEQKQQVIDLIKILIKKG